MFIIVPIGLIIFLIGFSIYYSASLAASRARTQRILAGDPNAPRLTPAEQQRLDAQAFDEMQRAAYSKAAADGMLPPIRQSAFQRIGTGLFMGELAYGSYQLFSGHHGDHSGNHGFDAVDLDNY